MLEVVPNQLEKTQPIMRFSEKVLLGINLLRCFPHLIAYYLSKNRHLIRSDVERNLRIKEKALGEPFGLMYLLTFTSQYRNLFYYRIRCGVRFLNMLMPKMKSLKIQTREIGPGFVVLHGIGSVIGAQSIGKNCKIYQQVTVGAYDRTNYPTILDNVTINAGAVIIGKVTIGNNVVIGANTTITKSIPDNCTVLPDSPRVVKWSGKSDIHKSQHWD